MMIIRAFFLLFMFLPFQALAETEIDVLCKVAHEYQQPDGVEYVAGDEDVVAADLNAVQQPIADPIVIPLSVDLAARFPDIDFPDAMDFDPVVGALSIHQDGRVFYNGQDLTSQAAMICGQKDKESAKNTDGHMVEDAVNSEAIEIKNGVEAEVLEPPKPDTDTLEVKTP